MYNGLHYRSHYRGWDKGTTRLTPEMYLALVVRILDNRHGRDVIERMEQHLGERAARMGPVDLSRNVLRSWCARICRAYSVPPMVSGLTPELVAALGDDSASTLVARYAEAGAAPMPTTVIQASARAQWYQEPGGFSGVCIGYSARSRRLTLKVITPDDLRLDYASEDPSEPTVIHYRALRQIGDGWREVVEVYDLTDPEVPTYRVMDGDQDVTVDIHGQGYDGDEYPWRYADGTPYHRIVVRGHTDRIYDHLQQVEASLVVPMRWTAWGSGTDFASHPGRNVRGLTLAGMASDTAQGSTGMADGPEVIKRWVDTDPDKPGDHWQDAPAFDPLTTARAVGLYESMVLSMIDLPLQMEATGGEPTAREAEAQEEAIKQTLPECRRFDSELLARCAALANRLDEVADTEIPEGPYGILYRGEVAEALDAAATRAGETDGRRQNRRGAAGGVPGGPAGAGPGEE